jgi:hypothetical protein
MISYIKNSLVAALLLFLNLHVLADSYQIYLPGQSSFDAQTRQLPSELQKLWIVNTDSNVVQQVDMSKYFQTVFPNPNPNEASLQIDFRGSSRIAQDFIGETLIIRDNGLINLSSLTTDQDDPLFGRAFYYDRVVKINVISGDIEDDYIVARSQDAEQLAKDFGFKVFLADGAEEVIPGFDMLTLKTFSNNTTTTVGDQATSGGLYTEKITASNGALLFRQEADGTVHIGEKSIVLADESVSASGYDEVYSSSGILQLGNNSDHLTIVKGSLKLEGDIELVGNISSSDPTLPSHVANKNYVDTKNNEIKEYIESNFAKKSYVDSGLASIAAMSSIPQATNGESMIGVGVGRYGSKSAIAFGLSSHFPKHNFNLNANVGYASGGKSAIGVGAGWRFK